MKLKSFVLATALTLSTAASAQWFAANVQFEISPVQIKAIVANVWRAPIRCSGNVYGITASGFQAVAGFDQFMYPGEYRYAYVYTNVYDTFRNYNTDITCSF